jgi:hypothetical protein
LVPGVGNNIIHGDVDCAFQDWAAGSFAVAVNDAIGDDIVFEIEAGCPPNAVVDARWLFYNDSVYDSQSSVPSAVDQGANGAGPVDHDDDAIDPKLVALLPGDGQATTVNYSNNTDGITGVMVDIVDACQAPVLGDFTFTDVGASGGLLGEVPVVVNPVDHAIRSLPGGGPNDYRCVFAFTPGTLAYKWLKVEIGTAFGLPSGDTHWWGNVVGDFNGPQGGVLIEVNALDESAVRANYAGPYFLNDPLSIYDINKDGQGNALDESFVRANYTTTAGGPAPPCAAITR